MIALFVMWVFMGSGSLALGHTALNVICSDTARLRPGDWLLSSLYLGLVIIGWLAVLVSFFTAVKPLVLFMLIAVLAIGGAYRYGDLLRNNLQAFMRPDSTVAIALLAIGAGFVAAFLRATPDTGEYHYPAIRWFAEYGTVPGVANVISRLGFVSSQWPLIAPFDTLLPGRALGVINGWILCLLGAQVAITARRIFRADAKPSDWFLCAGTVFMMSYGLIVGSFSNATADIIVSSAALVAMWRITASNEQPGLQAGLIPLALATGALNAKLSGLLLVPVAGLFAVWGGGMRRWIEAVALGLLLAAPIFVMSVLASGCLLYPLPQSCFSLPWSVPPNDVQGLFHMLRDWNPFPVRTGLLDWVPDWMVGYPYWWNAVIDWPFVLAGLGWLAIAIRRTKSISRAELWIVAIVLPSLILIARTNAEPRYDYAVFVAPLGLLAMRLGPLFAAPRQLSSLPITAIIAGCLALGQIGFTIAIERKRADLPTMLRQMLVPRAALSVATTPHRAVNFNYVMPVGGSACWGAPLPCADQILDSVSLRDPRRGLGSGFVKH